MSREYGRLLSSEMSYGESSYTFDYTYHLEIIITSYIGINRRTITSNFNCPGVRESNTSTSCGLIFSILYFFYSCPPYGLII